MFSERKDSPPPVLVVQERQEKKEKAQNIIERGYISGSNMRCILFILKQILGRVCDEAGVPLELEQYLSKEGFKMRIKLPLDEESGTKLALICKLQERIEDPDRVELMARRIHRFTREEASYWYSRATTFGSIANRWAVSGMRMMLG